MADLVYGESVGRIVSHLVEAEVLLSHDDNELAICELQVARDMIDASIKELKPENSKTKKRGK